MSFFNGDTGGLTSKDILSLPHSVLSSESKGEYSSACPSCGGHDRFKFWPAVGNHWCRQCGLKGFVADTPERRETTLRQHSEGRTTLSTPECSRGVEYNLLLYETPEAMQYWGRALGPKYLEAVDLFKLGYCPDYKGLGPTVTIPLGYCGRVFAIQHRILARSSGGKYIHEPSGCGAFLFNIDNVLSEPRIVLTEGIKKAMRLWLEGYPAVSTTTGGEYLKDWNVYFGSKKLYLVFDNDGAGRKYEEKAGKKTAEKRATDKRYAERSFEGLDIEVVELPDDGKIDDLINQGYDISAVLGPPWRE